MLVSTFYLTYPGALNTLCEMTELTERDVEKIVGRFSPIHREWAGLLKGEVYIYLEERIEIRHHFTKQLLWSSDH